MPVPRPLWLPAEAVDATEAVRRAAEIGIRGLEQGRWKPRFVLMHNDLWKDNILLDDEGRIAVIDWPGSTVKGYAMYDLVRLADSFGFSDRVCSASRCGLTAGSWVASRRTASRTSPRRWGICWATWTTSRCTCSCRWRTNVSGGWCRLCARRG
ncbi:MAG: phosphotransferase [Phycisphaerales bacterium]